MEISQFGFKTQMKISISCNITSATSTSAITIEGTSRLLHVSVCLHTDLRGWTFIGDILHCISQYRTSSHAQVIVSTPYSHFVGNTSGVGTRELLSQTVDVVKITITFVLVLLVQFILVEALIIKVLLGLMRDSGSSGDGTLAMIGDYKEAKKIKMRHLRNIQHLIVSKILPAVAFTGLEGD